MRKRGLFALLVLLTLTLRVSALAEGLDITVAQDKPAHAAGETAVLTVDIVNNTGLTVKNLQIQNIIPDGLVYADRADALKVVDTLLPGESARHTIRLRVAEANLPKTGDPSHPLLWGLATILCGAALLRMRKRREA